VATAPSPATDAQIRALLARYSCPVPFHAVRTRFLGAIASPDPTSAPIPVIEALWGGTLPEFDTPDAANELLGALALGLWNRLTLHLKRSAPFRLTRIDVPATREGLGRLALVRLEELEGFGEGLFGANESLDLPAPAKKGIGVLAEIRAMARATHEVALDLTKPGTLAEAAVTIKQFREITRIAEAEMHRVVLSCTQMRRQMAPPRPVMH